MWCGAVVWIELEIRIYNIIIYNKITFRFVNFYVVTHWFICLTPADLQQHVLQNTVSLRHPLPSRTATSTATTQDFVVFRNLLNSDIYNKFRI